MTAVCGDLTAGDRDGAGAACPAAADARGVIIAVRGDLAAGDRDVAAVRPALLSAADSGTSVAA